MSKMIGTRLRDQGKAEPVVLRYPQAGHGVFGPPLPAGSDSARYWSMMGGTEQANMAARQDSWPKTVASLRQHLTN